MSSRPTPDEISRDARWLAQALNPNAGVVRLIAMDRDSYRAASFLDDRMLQAPVDAQAVPWPLVGEAVAAMERSDARWIFHIGHVGSTLIARLLGELGGVLAIREPRLLRDVALAPEAVRISYVRAVPRLFSRTFGEEELALVKATSFVSEIAPELVAPGERALFIYAEPRAYVASILAGENSVQELHALSEARLARMAGRVTGLSAPRNDAERAAAAWACEMTALEASAEAMADRAVAWLDFDRALPSLAPELDRLAQFFGFAASPAELQAIAGGPLTRRYSKALEYEYSADLRRDLIAEATGHHGRDIDAALAMLERAAEGSPLLARALQRAQPER